MHTDEADRNLVFTANHYIGLELAEGAKTLDLSREVNDFKHLLMNYAPQEGARIFDGATMSVTIQNIRAVDLPDDVFEAGEVKPTKVLRRSGRHRQMRTTAAPRPRPARAAKKQQTAAAAS